MRLEAEGSRIPFLVKFFVQDLFSDSSERQRATIARSIVSSTRQYTPPGRFLRQDPTSGLWYDIGDTEATEKTISALRSGNGETPSGETELFSFDGCAKAAGKASEGKRKFDENEEESQVNVSLAMRVCVCEREPV